MTLRAADGARHAVRPLVADSSTGLHVAAAHLGGLPPDQLADLPRYGAAEALAIRGVESDQLRVLTREAEKLNLRVLSSEGRALVMGSLAGLGELGPRLCIWGRRTEVLGEAIAAALVGRGRGMRTLTAGANRLRTGERTLVMGIVNVTPDSFGGDSRSADPADAIARGLEMAAGGADMLDVGGESTRPHSVPVPVDEELARVLPVIRELAAQVRLPISIDTRKAAVAAAALDAGATIVNDVWGLRGDPEMAAVCASRPDALVVAMHNRRGTDTTVDIVEEVCVGLWRSLEVAEGAGIAVDRIVLDPGFGFGKTPAQNLELIRRLRELLGMGRPLLVGASRKSTVGYLLAGDNGVPPPEQRLEGSVAAAILAVANGAELVRVHDVAATARALRIADALVRGTPAGLRDLPAPGPTG